LLDPWPTLQAIAGLALFAAAVALLWPRRAALATFLVGAAGLGAFAYVKYVGVLRHQGHLWLLLLAALWIGGGPAPGEGGARRTASGRSWRAATLLALLVVHVLAGLYASWVDLLQPFSNGARTALLLRELGLDRAPLLGYREPPAASVALPLGRPLYSPSRRLFTTHPDWGPEQRDLSLPELRCAARAFAASEGQDVVLVMSSQLPPWDEVEPIGAVLGAIQESEEFRLYRLSHARLTGSAAAAGCAHAQGVAAPTSSLVSTEKSRTFE
jgi:hypothetical protein